MGAEAGAVLQFYHRRDVRDQVPESRGGGAVDDAESMHRSLPAALNPIGIAGKAERAEIPGVKIGLVAVPAVAEPQLMRLALFPVEIRLRLRHRRGNGRGLLGHSCSSRVRWPVFKARIRRKAASVKRLGRAVAHPCPLPSFPLTVIPAQAGIQKCRGLCLSPSSE